MERSDFKYDLLFDLSPDLLCIAGYDGYFKKVNPAVSKTLGYSMEELYARPIDDFVHADHKEVTSKARRELTRSKPLHYFENRYVTKGGETVWLSWTSFPIPSDKLIFAIAKNITHKKKLEANRNGLLASLASRNKDLVEMNFSATSDLRTAVHTMVALFDLIEPARVNDEETTKLLDILQYAAERVRRTLDNRAGLLAERNKKDLRAEQTDLQESLTRIRQSVNAIIETSGCTIAADFSEAPTVNFNKSYMDGIFLNLIINAINFASPERRPAITIRSERVGQRTQLLISDNGSGFDAITFKKELLSYPKKTQADRDGKGIGLYLVHSQVSAFGGEMDIESKADEGTKVIIRI